MEESLALVRQLVEDFKAQEAAYLSPQYQESQVREDFINKFFTALGWDVTHTREKNPYEQEVKIENRVRTEGSQRFADYAFFIKPNFRDVKFFVEAKKPSHDLHNAGYYHQAIRYGWNRKTPIAVLTDFEEFHILDCRYKPDIKTALDRKIEVYHYTDYAEEETFKKIFFLFGRDAVANSSLAKYADSLLKPRGKSAKKGLLKGGYQQVDEAFLGLLDGYRDTLAHAFKNKNANLDGEALTEAVQRTLDRLVFIRFLEDKGIEDPKIIDLGYNPSVWNAFARHCRYFDAKYNGLVFKPHPVIDASTFIPPDDDTFADICNELADPASPYDFNSIPISILGSIYERFLGKVVTTTDKRAKVIEKPEVRKAGGVYYTPEYIVRYIVSETLGKLLYETDGELGQTAFRLSPAEVAKLRIADVACGSGSFLLEVYSQLLDYHTRYYNQYPEKAKKGDTETREGRIVLSHKKRNEILVNNIYGVDIDFQATEVTQLSLYLKLMEDVTMNDAFQFSLLKERMLPDLRRNIVCGNSLIGRDILDGKLFSDDNIEHKLKPMDLQHAFVEIFRGGGFDIVVGNPPYGFEFGPIEKGYLNTKFKVAEGNYESFAFFIERAIDSLKQNGFLGYILPDTWFTTKTAERLRKFILTESTINELQVLNEHVFDDAKVDVCTLILQVGTLAKPISIVIYDKDASSAQLASGQYKSKKTIRQDSWRTNKESAFTVNVGANEQIIVKKIHAKKIILDDICLVGAGCKPYEMGKGSPPQTKRIMDERMYTATTRKDNTFRLMLRGSDIERYLVRRNEEEWLSYGPWLAAQRNPVLFAGTRLIFQSIRNPKLTRRLIGTLVNDNSVNNNSITNIVRKDNRYELAYILGILNSTLLNWYFSVSYSIVNIDPRYLKEAPIYPIDFNRVNEKERHDRIVRLVEQIIKAKEKHATSTTESETNRLDMQIESLDRQIDEAVYELYGLTEEEIKVVEGVNEEK